MEPEPCLGPHPSGNLIKASTNYFKINIKQNVFRYHVKLSPESPEFKQKFLSSLTRNKGVAEFLQKHFEIYLILNFTLYSPSWVEEDLTYETVYEGFPILLSIKNSGILNMSDNESNNFFGWLMKGIQNKMGMVSIGHSRFEPSKEKVFNNRLFKVWPGFSTSVNSFQGQFMINLDLNFKVLSMETVWKYMNELFDQNYSKEDVKNALKGLSVITLYNNKVYQIFNVEFQKSPADEFFFSKKSKNITFIQYYHEKYKRTVLVKDQPLLEVKEKKAKEPGNSIYLVPELCSLIGLSECQRNDFNCMRDLATITKPPPQKRISEAQTFIENMITNSKTIKNITNWGIEIDRAPFSVEGTFIAAGYYILGSNPKAGGSRTLVRLDGGNDLSQKIQVPMYSQPKISKWALFYSSRDRENIKKLRFHLKQATSDFQYDIEMPKEIEVPSDNWIDWESAIQILDETVDLAVFVINGKKNTAKLYAPLKSKLISRMPVPSQVILSSTLQRDKNLRSICNNILIQICAKVGGIPWAIDELPFTDTPTMIIGMSVKNDPLKKSNSLFSFCSTVDCKFSKYWSYCKKYPFGQNLSKFIEFAFEAAIVAFEKANKVKPKTIIIYRDGIADSMRKVTEDLEVMAFRETLKKLGMNSNLIHTCVNKRTHVKFFNGDNLKRSEFSNPAPGMVISEKITSDRDFYLISHLPRQGSSTPTHYYVLINDFDEFETNDMEKLNQSTRKVNPMIFKNIQILTYKLCFMYYNSVGSIKLPSPIQYAQRLIDLIGDKLAKADIEPSPYASCRNSLYFI